MTQEFQNRILEAILADGENHTSANKQATTYGINPAQLSRVKKGDLAVLSEAKWLMIARRLDVQQDQAQVWNTAETKTFIYIWSQLEFCQKNSTAGLICDAPDIGKTHTARDYCRVNKNAVLIDCSQVKSKQKLVREIAKQFGVTPEGRYADVYADLMYYLNTTSTAPIVILDEFGDIDYPAILEVKAMWNATEGTCAWYVMGADGLKAKMEGNIGRRKVGYAELFSRFGSAYQKISPEGKEEFIDFKKTQMAKVALANATGLDLKTVFAKTSGSLRKLRTELKKR